MGWFETRPAPRSRRSWRSAVALAGVHGVLSSLFAFFIVFAVSQGLQDRTHSRWTRYLGESPPPFYELELA